MAIAQVDHLRKPLHRDPIGFLTGRVFALAFAFDGDGHLAATVVAGDMGLVADHIRNKGASIVQTRAFGQPRHIEGKEDIDQT